MKIVAARKILRANNQLAEENRARFKQAGAFAVNVVGSPGCGKTTFLEALFRALDGRVAPAVIEGDIASSIDAERIEKLGVPVVQINTDGACHLDATMVTAAADSLELDKIGLLVIENVGNLVCTAGFDLGENLRIVLLSVSEGDDKIAKYPAIFQRSGALIITKTDLLAQSNFSVERAVGDMRRLSPNADIFQVSALHDEGLDRDEGMAAVADWLMEKCRSGSSE